MSYTDLVLAACAGRAPGPSGWVRADCPLCEGRTGRPDRKQCLGLRVETGFYHCFRCAAAGMIEVSEDLAFLARAAPEAAPGRIELPEGFLRLYEEPGWSSWAAEPARDYLRARGIDDDLGHDARIGVCLEGRYRGRVVVPVYAVDEHTLLGWSARDYTGRADRKYLYPAGMRRAEILYNAQALFTPTGAPVFVVEGVFDALAFWPDAVACLGKPTSAHFEALCASGRPVVALLDGDAWREAQALAWKLRIKGRRAAFVRLPPKIDPATCAIDEVRAHAAQALEDSHA